MIKVLFAVFLATFCPAVLVFAFSDTIPIVAWSSHHSTVLDALPVKPSHSVDLLESILLNEDICDNDAIVLVQHPGLHASDLRTLPPTSLLSHSLTSAPFSFQFPYVRCSYPSTPFANFTESVSRRCNSRLVNFQSGTRLDEGKKHVVCMTMPRVEGVPLERKGVMAKHASRLSNDLASVIPTFSRYLIIYAGSPTSPLSLSKRQLRTTHFLAPGNTTLASGSILHRYQLLTPALITTLLVTLFVLVPVIFIGIKALSSIQSPLRVEGIKGFSAVEKKNN